MDDLVGSLIGERFRVVRLLGMGGMGAVYEARHVTLPRTYAIKVLRPQLARDEAFVERFRREAIAASRVEHPNVIRITDFGQTDTGAVFLVMEYLQGVSLDRVLEKQHRLPAARTLSILAQIADALDLAHHMNVVHRDLKPENIQLIEDRGRKDFVKLLDFGIAKVQTPEFDGAPLTIRGEVFGTAEYMSPEQALGRPVDGRSDIYALGCMAYELLTGEPPFTGSAVEVLRRHVYTEPAPPSTRLRSSRISPVLDALVLRCLAKDPGRRYHTGGELREELLRVRALVYSLSEPIAARRRVTGRLASVGREELTRGWRPLGSRIPELILPSAHSVIVGGTAPREAGTAAAAGTAADAASACDELRDACDGLVRQLAFTLVKAALAPADTGELLERLLVVEEEEAALTGTIALGEQGFDRVRYDHGQRERQLRRAIVNLEADRGDLSERATAAPDGPARQDLERQMQDLAFQIDELARRCQEVDSERDAQIRELDQELRRHRGRQHELEQDAAEILRALRTQVEALRAEAIARGSPELKELYQRFEGARQRLRQATSRPRQRTA